jgi:hypothetical protein
LLRNSFNLQIGVEENYAQRMAIANGHERVAKLLTLYFSSVPSKEEIHESPKVEHRSQDEQTSTETKQQEEREPIVTPEEATKQPPTEELSKLQVESKLVEDTVNSTLPKENEKEEATAAPDSKVEVATASKEVEIKQETKYPEPKTTVSKISASLGSPKCHICGKRGK